MEAGTLRDCMSNICTEFSEGTPVYASEVNASTMRKVVGIQARKSFADNGEEACWIEIIYADNQRR